MISEKIIDNLIEILDKSFLNDKNIRLNIKSLLEKDLLRDNICNSFTNKGKRCKNKKKPDELYCGLHLKEKEKLKKYLIEKNIIKEKKIIETQLIESEDDEESTYESEYELNMNESEDDDILSDHDYEEEEEIRYVSEEFKKKVNIKPVPQDNFNDEEPDLGDELDFDY
jgi:hypothetical protein